MSTRNISINIVWAFIVLLLMDAYVYMALRKSIRKSKWENQWNTAYFGSLVLGYIGFYYLYFYFTSKPLNGSLIPNLFIGYFFAFTIFKSLLILIFVFEDLVRFLKLLVSIIANIFRSKKEKLNKTGRRGFIRKTGLLIAGIPFASMIYGITKGKYNFRVNKVILKFDNLPAAFDGFKIVHISDIHSGSFDNKDAILEGIQLVNQQNADIILFTGDLVNNDSREIIPYIDDFKQLKATNGVFSVLGNHDYGDYKKWDTVEDKKENMELLYKFQHEMGFKLLNNEHATISKGNDSLGIFGVENWGNPPFPQRGDLDEALIGKEKEPFKILMSHDPTHWNKKVVDHPVHIDLTLSGHTHGMQFGVEIPGFKWSPIKYIYPQWAGLYRKNKQLLYVNRGFGFLGFPGRVGIWPEITCIELSKKA